jgi:hypothetical protein
MNIERARKARLGAYSQGKPWRVEARAPAPCLESLPVGPQSPDQVDIDHPVHRPEYLAQSPPEEEVRRTCDKTLFSPTIRFLSAAPLATAMLGKQRSADHIKPSVDVVVKATVARAGQIAATTENSIAEPAPATAKTLYCWTLRRLTPQAARDLPVPYPCPSEQANAGERAEASLRASSSRPASRNSPAARRKTCGIFATVATF